MINLEDYLRGVKENGLNSAKDGTLSGTLTASGTLDVTGTLQIGSVSVTATAAELNILDGVTATAAEINSAADVSGKYVAVADANYTVLAADSGKPHIVANVSADRTFTLPTPAAGLDYEFIADVVAADGHDWIIDTGSDTNYFTGSIIHHDTDAAPWLPAVVAPNGSSNSILQVNLPQGSTILRFISDGTTWNISGQAVSATAPTFANQA